MSIQASLVVRWTLCGLAGCWQASDREVVVYSALDAEFAEPILEQYAREQAVDVRPNFDVESTKTVGLVTRIQQERSHPRCDVFWNNEILHTLRSGETGSAGGLRLAGGGRVPGELPVAPRLLARVRRPRTRAGREHAAGRGARASAIDRGPGRRAVAGAGGHRQTVVRHNGHARQCAVRHAGAKRGHRSSFASCKENAQVLSGNKQVALAVGRGELAFGLTDTDDAVDREGGRPTGRDRLSGSAGRRHGDAVHPQHRRDHPRRHRIREQARALVDYLLSAAVETAVGRGTQRPVPGQSAGLRAIPRRAADVPVRWMEADFAAAADQWETAAAFLRDLFATADVER